MKFAGSMEKLAYTWSKFIVEFRVGEGNRLVFLLFKIAACFSFNLYGDDSSFILELEVEMRFFGREKRFLNEPLLGISLTYGRKSVC